MPQPDAPLPLLAAADLQDHLLSTVHDLDRLQTLLSDACTTLLSSFHGANEQLRWLGAGDAAANRIAQHLCGAVVALQFQDMGSQLIAHTRRRLRYCADRLARDTLQGDEEEDAWVEEPPLHPNPVTQAEMDAGSVTLF